MDRQLVQPVLLEHEFQSHQPNPNMHAVVAFALKSLTFRGMSVMSILSWQLVNDSDHCIMKESKVATAFN